MSEILRFQVDRVKGLVNPDLRSEPVPNKVATIGYAALGIVHPSNALTQELNLTPTAKIKDVLGKDLQRFYFIVPEADAIPKLKLGYYGSPIFHSVEISGLGFPLQFPAETKQERREYIEEMIQTDHPTYSASAQVTFANSAGSRQPGLLTVEV